MEFHITMPGPIDPGAMEHALQASDPSALVDLDPATGVLRVAAMLDVIQLVAELNRAGYPVHRAQVTQTPTTCCGGCGG